MLCLMVDPAPLSFYHINNIVKAQDESPAADDRPTLGELAVSFLAGLSAEAGDRAQQEVFNFAHWYGWNRLVSELSAPNVASYAEQTTSSGAETARKLQPVRAFLNYAWKRRLTKANLGVHLRPKKGPSKSSLASGLASQTPVVLTAEGRAKLEAELASLARERAEVIEEVQKAAADKDFRENAPLQAAREHQGHLEGRIQELQSALKSARLVEQGQSISSIRLGSAVVIQDLGSGKEFNYVLVHPREADPLKGKISVASPIGKALLGRREGEAAEINAPAGTFRYRIQRVQH
jgi:transcription elongation factor GreA